MSARSLVERLAENAFAVLAVPREASRPDIERQGQKWLSMLALGLKEAGHYQTPFGARARTEALVREAMSLLRDPHRRLLEELLAALPPEVVIDAARGAKVWPEALVAVGLGRAR
jgi:hypothetical protein